MRVAYLVNQYPAPSHTFIRREIRALEASGVEVKRFTLRRWRGALVDPADREELARTRCVQCAGAIHALFCVLAAGPMRLAAALALALRAARGSDRGLGFHFLYLVQACILVRWLRRAGAQHLHAHFGTNPAEVAMLCHALGGPPYSFTVHGPEELERAAALGYADKIGRARFVVAISEYCRSQLLRWCEPAQRSKVRIVRCGLERALLGAPRAPLPAAPRLVCVGRLCAEKGHRILLDAAARLKSEGRAFELVLVGDGPLRGELEALIRRRALEDRVTMTGWLPAARVAGEIERARALVLASFAEGLPVVIMEALAAGRPVIGTSIAAIPELVQPGVNGWLVPAGDVAELARAMRAALDADPADLERMAARGRAALEARHDVHHEAATLARYFRTLAHAAAH